MKATIVLGTRPEIIKLSPIIRKLNKKNSTVIYTGQHYDFEMGMRFIDELGIRKPDFKIKLTKKSKNQTETATQMSEIIGKLAGLLSQISTDTVIVQGDTNTVLAGAVASIKSGIPISHVESGLRSYDWRMPEEHNRIATDHISEFLFTPTTYTRKILQKEQVHGKIFVTGNTSIDAINDNVKKAQEKRSLDLPSSDFVLATIHRAENVDDNKTLKSIVKALIKSNEKIILPLHPRTQKNLKKFGLYDKVFSSKNLMLTKPLGYFDMIYLMKKCTFIISDSGGIQEEATSPKIRKKVLIIRKSTDRKEAVDSGYAELVGTNYERILNSIKKTSLNPEIKSHSNPYGVGNASKKTIDILKKAF